VSEGPDENEGDREAVLREAERRRRRARVFGDVLPDATQDERGDGWSEREPVEGSDEWFRRQVPPHHG
jgi:hypothetical protein